MNAINLSKIHDCDKCHGKIVGITVDKLGNTYCGYCNERVDYSALKLTGEEVAELLKETYNMTDKKWEQYLEEK